MKFWRKIFGDDRPRCKCGDLADATESEYRGYSICYYCSAWLDKLEIDRQDEERARQSMEDEREALAEAVAAKVVERLRSPANDR